MTETMNGELLDSEKENDEDDSKQGEESSELLEKLKQELEETKTKLSKLEKKDYNFAKLRKSKALKEMTDEEREKLTEFEQELKAKQEELEEQQVNFKEQMIKSYQNDALVVLAGDDDGLRKKIIDNYNRITGEAITKEEVSSKMREAFNMIGSHKGINPINKAHNAGGSSIKQSKSRLNENQMELAKKLGITNEDIKKYL